MHTYSLIVLRFLAVFRQGAVCKCQTLKIDEQLEDQARCVYQDSLNSETLPAGCQRGSMCMLTLQKRG